MCGLPIRHAGSLSKAQHLPEIGSIELPFLTALLCSYCYCMLLDHFLAGYPMSVLNFITCSTETPKRELYIARLHKVYMFWPLIPRDIQDTEAPNLHFLEG